MKYSSTSLFASTQHIDDGAVYPLTLLPEHNWEPETIYTPSASWMLTVSRLGSVAFNHPKAPPSDLVHRTILSRSK